MNIKLTDIPPSCIHCSNHPSNGGSGVCHCILGDWNSTPNRSKGLYKYNTITTTSTNPLDISKNLFGTTVTKLRTNSELNEDDTQTTSYTYLVDRDYFKMTL